MAIEVDVTSPGVRKLPIYHGLGVPEAWVWDHAAQTLTAYRRRDGGEGAGGGWDESTTASGELPGFPLDAAADLIRGWDGRDDGALEDAFLARLRAAG